MCVLITAVPITKQGDFSKAITHHSQDLSIAKEVVDRAGEGRACANLGTCRMYLNEYDLNEYVNSVAYFEAQHTLAISLKLAHVQSDAALNMGVALTLHVRARRQGPLLALTKLLDRIVTRWHRRASMIECMRRQSGSRLPSTVVISLQNCTWRTSPFMRAKRTQRWHISKSTSHCACNGDVTLAPAAGKRGVRTR